MDEIKRILNFQSNLIVLVDVLISGYFVLFQYFGSSYEDQTYKSDKFYQFLANFWHILGGGYAGMATAQQSDLLSSAELPVQNPSMHIEHIWLDFLILRLLIIFLYFVQRPFNLLKQRVALSCEDNYLIIDNLQQYDQVNHPGLAPRTSNQFEAKKRVSENVKKYFSGGFEIVHLNGSVTQIVFQQIHLKLLQQSQCP